MTRKGYVAAVLFCLLSGGGIITLFEQSYAGRDSGKGTSPGMRSMDVSSPETNVFKEVVPAALEHGAFLQHREKPTTAPPEKPAPPRLSLR